MNKVLVFGKNGQVSSKLSEYSSVINIGHKTINLLSPKDCYQIINKIKPSFVINAAAMTDVDKCETKKEEAKIINGISPGEMAKACNKINAYFIHLSTDYVYDGKKKLPYTTRDNCKPLNIYGKSKLLGEKNIIKNTKKYIILRTSWIFSEKSNNFIKKIIKFSNDNKIIKIVDDQVGGPTYSGDVANACLNIIEKLQKKNLSGIYNFAGYPDISRYNLALEIFRLLNKKNDIIPVKTSNFKTMAIRPLNTRLNCVKLKKDFRIKRPLWKEKILNSI